MSRKVVKVVLVVAILAVVAGVGFMAFKNTDAMQVFRNRLRGKPEMTEDREHFLNHEGRKRRYVVHVPQGYDGTKPVPVVLSFHGGMGRAEIQRTQSRMNEVADRHGFLVVYPDGTGLTRMLTFNAGTCCGYAVRNDVDDVGFVRKILDDLPKQYAVDANRVYATGMSNGAMLCYRLACELSDRIAAIGPVSGDLGVDGPAPMRPVPVIHFHGMKDENAMFHGGKGRNQFQPTPHRSIPDTIAWWAKANNCQAEPVEVKVEKDYIRKNYAPAAGRPGAPVILYALPEGGHTWPGGVDVSERFGTGKLIESVNASEIMWRFFEQHTLAGPVQPGR